MFPTSIVLKTLLAICIIRISYGVYHPPRSYALKFPDEPHLAYAHLKNISIADNSQGLSVSMWVLLKPSGRQAHLFTYALASPDNQSISFALAEEEVFFVINGKSIPLEHTPTFDKWMHLIVAWDTQEKLSLFQNGKEVLEEALPTIKFQLKTNGELVLGHYEEQANMVLNKIFGFSGEITGVNVWNKFLSNAEAKRVFEAKLEGNVVAWSKDFFKMAGYIKVVKTDPVVRENIPVEKEEFCPKESEVEEEEEAEEEEEEEEIEETDELCKAEQAKRKEKAKTKTKKVKGKSSRRRGDNISIGVSLLQFLGQPPAYILSE